MSVEQRKIPARLEPASAPNCRAILPCRGFLPHRKNYSLITAQLTASRWQFRSSTVNILLGISFPSAPRAGRILQDWPQTAARKGIFSKCRSTEFPALTASPCCLRRGEAQRGAIMGSTAQLSLRAALSPALGKLDSEPSPGHHPHPPSCTDTARTTAGTAPARAGAQIQENLQQLCPKNEQFSLRSPTVQTTQREPTARGFQQSLSS